MRARPHGDRFRSKWLVRKAPGKQHGAAERRAHVRHGVGHTGSVRYGIEAIASRDRPDAHRLEEYVVSRIARHGASLTLVERMLNYCRMRLLRMATHGSLTGNLFMRYAPLALLGLISCLPRLAGAQSFAPDTPEAGSVEEIAKATTETRFLSPWVAYLPASTGGAVSPRSFLHRIPGAPGELVNSATAYAYCRALAGSSARVRVFTIGRSEEGRDIVLLAIADEAGIRDLDRLVEQRRGRTVARQQVGLLLVHALHVSELRVRRG